MDRSRRLVSKTKPKEIKCQQNINNVYFYFDYFVYNSPVIIDSVKIDYYYYYIRDYFTGNSVYKQYMCMTSLLPMLQNIAPRDRRRPNLIFTGAPIDNFDK